MSFHAMSSKFACSCQSTFLHPFQQLTSNHFAIAAPSKRSDAVPYLMVTLIVLEAERDALSRGGAGPSLKLDSAGEETLGIKTPPVP